MSPEARLTETESGLAPETDGWFVVNISDAHWRQNEKFGASCLFEGEPRRFPELGIRICVLQPGQPNGLYHADTNQEDFLVLSGECLLLIDGEERPLRTWDFVHCPADTPHIFLGAGDAPCGILMVGARTEGKKLLYPDSELARRHGAGADAETPLPSEAYASHPEWRPGRPDLTGTPWMQEER